MVAQGIVIPLVRVRISAGGLKSKNSIKIVIVYPLFYDKVFALARRSPSIKSIMSRRTWDVGERDPCSVTG